MIVRAAAKGFHLALFARLLRLTLLIFAFVLILSPVTVAQASLLGHELQAYWRYDLRSENDNFPNYQTVVVGSGIEFRWNRTSQGGLICDPNVPDPTVAKCNWQLWADFSETSLLIAFEMARDPLLGFSFDSGNNLFNQLEFFDVNGTIPSIERLEFVSSTLPNIPDVTGPDGRWLIPNLMNGRFDDIIVELSGISGLPPEPTNRLRHEILFDIVYFEPAAVPIPAAVWLFGTALLGLIGFSRRRKAGC